MRFIWRRVPTILFLCVTLLLLSRAFSLLSHLSNHLLSFSFLNALVFAIIVGSRRRLSSNGTSEGMGFFQSFNEPGSFSEEIGKMNDEEEEEDENDKYDGDVLSDGYYEDDDDSDDVTDDGTTDECESEGEGEDYDDNLNSRIEDFIAKVTNGWKEEKLREKNDSTKSP